MTDFGYILMARGIMHHPRIGAKKPYSEYEAWNWLLFEAAWRPRRVRVSNGRASAVVELQRGQLIHSRSYLAEAWGWTEKRVRTYLRHLENDRQIAVQTGQLQTLITICNYEQYQSKPTHGGRQTGQQTGPQWAGNGPEEERSKSIKDSFALEKRTSEKKRTGEVEGFAEWYQAYPRKKQRDDAARAYRKAVPFQISAADLLSRTKTFAVEWGKRPKGDLQFCPYPASWLNSGEYKDAAEATAQNAPAPKPTRDPRTFTAAEWLQRVTAWRDGTDWPDTYWGPPPGNPGCLVPTELLSGGANTQ